MYVCRVSCVMCSACSQHNRVTQYSVVKTENTQHKNASKSYGLILPKSLMQIRNLDKMDTHYDEDLSQNAVVATISQSYPELLKKVIAEGWIICAPRLPIASPTKNCEQDEHWIMRHILVPKPTDDEGPKIHFRYSHMKCRSINQFKFITMSYGFPSDHSTTRKFTSRTTSSK